MTKMEVFFKTQGGQIKPGVLPESFKLDDFIKLSKSLFDSIENVRFLVKGKQLKTDDAKAFAQQRNLFHDKCVIQMVIRQKGGYRAVNELLTQIHCEIPNAFKANANNSNVKCVACVDMRQCIKFNCPNCQHVHILCIDCAILYFTMNELSLKCFQCKKEIDYHGIFPNSSNFVQMLDELHEIYETARNIDCQICYCGELQVNETLYSKQYCNKCQRWYCFFCNNTWNDKLMKNSHYTCHNNCYYENAITYELVDLRHNSAVKLPNRRTCPKCRTLGSYGDACQMHTCRFCSHQFCFICLRDENICKYNKDKKCVLATQNYSIFPKSTD